MRTKRAALLAVSLALAAVAQAPSREAIYDQARNAAGQVPANLQAWYLLTIAEQEALFAMSGAVTDAQQAFRLADGSAAAHSNDEADHGTAIMALTLVGGFGSQSHALQLVHSSLYRPLAPYYSVLLDSNHLRRVVVSLFGLVPAVREGLQKQEQAWLAAPDSKPFPFDPLVLAQDCFARDRSYPLGAMALLLRPQQAKFDPPARLAMAREVLAHMDAAGNNGPALRDAAGALGIIHGNVPELDAEVLKAVPALLRRVADDGSPDADFAGRHLLQIATDIDPHLGAELEAEYPQARFASHAGAFPPPRPAPPDAQGDSAAAGAISPSSPAELAQKSELLAEVALHLAASEPDRALGAAREFADLITVQGLAHGPDKLLRNSAILAQTLALRLDQRAMAEAMMTQCLDAAELRAEAAQQDYDRAEPADRPSVFEKEIAYPNTGVQIFKAAAEIFGLAAQVDPQLAWRRASASEAPLFKPLFLLRAAMVAPPDLSR